MGKQDYLKTQAQTKTAFEKQTITEENAQQYTKNIRRIKMILSTGSYAWKSTLRETVTWEEPESNLPWPI